MNQRIIEPLNATRHQSLIPDATILRYVEKFNALDAVEDVVNLISNAQAADWIADQVPRFDCPDAQLVETYWYRWWCFRKHIKATPFGRIVTEFISDVRHAGTFNSISCALGHHIAEGRWLHDQSLIDEYVRFFFRNADGKPEYRFHRYSSWVAAALWNRWKVTRDDASLVDLLDDLVADYHVWETEKLLSSGLFFQYDVWDGMEESISGGRKVKNVRPTINSYMIANARAIAEIASLPPLPVLGGRSGGALPIPANSRSSLPASPRVRGEGWVARANALSSLSNETMWDDDAKFYKVVFEDDSKSSAREAIDFIPWIFDVAPNECEQDRANSNEAWKQLIDPQGFWAPAGITTAERRHPQFRSHGVGQCEWDGACWPFATSQTLEALANAIRKYGVVSVSRRHFCEAVVTYSRAHRFGDRPYIGEYHDEITGEWLKGDNPRSRFYNHSTFADLIITGIVGLVPRDDDVLEIDPMLTNDFGWDWFALEAVPWRGKSVSIVWDRDGTKYGRGVGLSICIDGEEVARADRLTRLETTVEN